MAKKIKIRWEVEDGYAGGSRPHTTTIDIERDFGMDEWREMSEQEKEEVIHDYVQADFEQQISYAIISKEEV